jgi:hypothetical protein
MTNDRTPATAGRSGRSALRVVLGTVLVSAAVLGAGYATGLLLGRVLLQ